jgi:hypothetical protein
MAELLQPVQCGLIFKISFLSLGSSMYAIYNGHRLIALCPAVVFLTSINYWRKPENTWRRNLDMTCVQLSLLYQIYKAYGSRYMMQYYISMVLGISMYPLSIYYYKQKQYWSSTYAHCALHIISNIANIIL